MVYIMIQDERATVLTLPELVRDSTCVPVIDPFFMRGDVPTSKGLILRS